MTSPEQPSIFDGAVGEQFIDHYHQVRGYIREQLTRQNLQPFLPLLPAHVMDVGGGDGRDALWLARQGYDVALIDPAADMLARAKQALAKDSPEVQAKLTVREGDERIAMQYTAERGLADLVLSHGVVMYVDQPAQYIKNPLHISKPLELI